MQEEKSNYKNLGQRIFPLTNGPLAMARKKHAFATRGVKRYKIDWRRSNRPLWLSVFKRNCFCYIFFFDTNIFGVTKNEIFSVNIFEYFGSWHRRHPLWKWCMGKLYKIQTMYHATRKRKFPSNRVLYRRKCTWWQCGDRE